VLALLSALLLGTGLLRAQTAPNAETVPANEEETIKLSPFVVEEQIIYDLRSVDAGAKIGDVCRQLGVAEQTYYRWKKQYDGFGVSEKTRVATELVKTMRIEPSAPPLQVR
jgi:hypothetical protein